MAQVFASFEKTLGLKVEVPDDKVDEIIGNPELIWAYVEADDVAAALDDNEIFCYEVDAD